jgi:hypothetical protein
MSKKLKMKQIKRIFNMLAQGRPEPERQYIKGIIARFLGRAGA